MLHIDIEVFFYVVVNLRIFQEQLKASLNTR